MLFLAPVVNSTRFCVTHCKRHVVNNCKGTVVYEWQRRGVGDISACCRVRGSNRRAHLVEGLNGLELELVWWEWDRISTRGGTHLEWIHLSHSPLPLKSGSPNRPASYVAYLPPCLQHCLHSLIALCARHSNTIRAAVSRIHRTAPSVHVGEEVRSQTGVANYDSEKRLDMTNLSHSRSKNSHN